MSCERGAIRLGPQTALAHGLRLSRPEANGPERASEASESRGTFRVTSRLPAAKPGHPEVRIDSPESAGGAPTEHDLGTIVVPDARTIRVRLLHADGTSPHAAHDLWEATVEDFPGAVWIAARAGDGGFDCHAVAPPLAGAAILVRARERGRAVVWAPVPSLLDATHPMELRVPATQPAPGGGVREARGSQ